MLNADVAIAAYCMCAFQYHSKLTTQVKLDEVTMLLVLAKLVKPIELTEQVELTQRADLVERVKFSKANTCNIELAKLVKLAQLAALVEPA